MVKKLLSDCNPGDRFYFVGDRKKKVYQLNDEKPFEVKKQVGYHIKYANCRDTAATSGTLQVSQHKANRSVIFLRNVNQK